MARFPQDDFAQQGVFPELVLTEEVSDRLKKKFELRRNLNPKKAIVEESGGIIPYRHTVLAAAVHKESAGSQVGVNNLDRLP